MKRQQLSGNGKRVLGSMLICCLWVCAVPAAARAQATLNTPVCSVQKQTNGRMVQWTIKGTAQLTGIDPQNASTNFSYAFQTSNDGGKTWTDMNIDGTVATAAVNGTANLDTGWIGTGAPAQGQQYRVAVGASYTDGNGKVVQIVVKQSATTTPNP